MFGICKDLPDVSPQSSFCPSRSVDKDCINSAHKSGFFACEETAKPTVPSHAVDFPSPFGHTGHPHKSQLYGNVASSINAATSHVPHA